MISVCTEPVTSDDLRAMMVAKPNWLVKAFMYQSLTLKTPFLILRQRPAF